MVNTKKTNKSEEKPEISQKKPKFNKFKYRWTLFRLRTEGRWTKFKEYVKTSLDKKDKDMIKSYLAYSLLQGLFLNLALLSLGVNFSILNVISFGSALWILETKLIKFWRRLFFKIPNEKGL